MSVQSDGFEGGRNRRSDHAMTTRSGDHAIGSAALGADRGEGVLDATGTRAAGDLAMERYAAGDDDAFAAVYDALAARVRGYLRRHVRDAHRCDDLLQETFLRMHRARGTFVKGGAVLPWALAIARRLMLDQVRRDRRASCLVSDAISSRSLTPSPVAHPEHLVEARELAGRLADAVARLPDSQRSAFELLKREGLTLTEAAGVLGVTVTAVKLRAHRAYTSVRGTIRQYLGGLKETVGS